MNNFIEELWIIKILFKNKLVAPQIFFLLPCNLYNESLLVM